MVGRLGHHRPDAVPALSEPPDQLQALVSGDSAANDEKDTLGR